MMPSPSPRLLDRGSNTNADAWPALAKDEIHVWRFDLDGALPGAPEICDEAEMARAGRFVFDRDRHRFLAGRRALRRILARYLDRNAAALTFELEENGKPVLRRDGDIGGSGARHLDFNLSHAAGMGMLAVGRDRRIGVDVELLRQPSDLRALAASVFSRAERKAFDALNEHALATPFFIAWTRKEACMKATGIGLKISPASIDVGLVPDTRRLPLTGLSGDLPGEVRTIVADARYVASVATVGRLPPVRMFRFDAWQGAADE